jgi:TolB-like protein
MKQKLFGIVPVFTVVLLLAISCITGGTSTKEAILLDQAIKTISENITQNLGYSTLTASLPSNHASIAEETMQTGNMDIESIRRQAINFNRKPKIAVLNFNSPSAQFSTYIIEELSKYLIDTKDFIVVERSELDLIWRENELQMSDDVSDESIVGIGKQLGAQFIVSGSLTSIGNIYRCRIKVLNVETTQILLWPSWDINTRESKVVTLLAGAKPPREGKKPNAPQTETIKTYQIGDKGPGGGIVFFAENGKYMECSKELGKARWSKALQIAKKHRGGGKPDWFLPTIEELNLVYNTLYKKGYGRFADDEYWSSDDVSSSAGIYGFSSGYSTWVYKGEKYRVCAVRSF